MQEKNSKIIFDTKKQYFQSKITKSSNNTRTMWNEVYEATNKLKKRRKHIIIQ